MANSNLAIRFSEEIYASRSEVARELRTNLVDGIWNNIVTYRSSFVSNLDIYDVSKNAYYMVNTSLIVRKNNDLAIKLSRLLSKTSAWINNKIERITVSNEMKKAELIAVAKSLNIIINDVAVDNINDIYVDAKTDMGDVKIKNNNRKSDITLTIDDDMGDIRVK